MAKKMDMRRGSTTVLVLSLLSESPMYGYQICKAVNAKTDGYFELREGSLYPALHKLERDGLLKSFWEQTEAGRRRKYYQITGAGKKALSAKRREWSRFSTAVQWAIASIPLAIPLTIENPSLTSSLTSILQTPRPYALARLDPTTAIDRRSPGSMVPFTKSTGGGSGISRRLSG